MIVPKFSTDGRSDRRLQKRIVLTVDFSFYNMRNGVFAILMDGSVLTHAPLFAAAFATHQNLPMVSAWL
jgi:hypothetical protein